MKEYEVIWEIFNKCPRNQMRDVFVEEVEIADPEAYVKQKFQGKDVSYEKTVLEDGTIITAHSSELLGCSAALLLNVTKHLAQIDHEIKLIPQSMIEPIQHTKVSYLGGRNPRLHTDEVLVALSVLSENDENCRRALEQLPKLRGCQVHCTVMLSEVDQRIFKKLGVNLTCEPVLKR